MKTRQLIFASLVTLIAVLGQPASAGDQWTETFVEDGPDKGSACQIALSKAKLGGGLRGTLIHTSTCDCSQTKSGENPWWMCQVQATYQRY